VTKSFPGATRPFTPKVDLVNTIYADHVNALQEEVGAIEDTLGAGTLTSSYTGSFVATTDWETVSDRLVNIERGLANGVASAPYVRSTGGDTLMATAGTVGLVFKSASGNSANLFETRSSNNTLGFRVDASGTPYVGNKAILYVDNSAYSDLQTNLQAVITAATTTVSPFLLAGI
jgi:hypothetical protein